MAAILWLELDIDLLLAATREQWGFSLPLTYLEEVTKTINVIKIGLQTSKYWGFFLFPESISEYFIPLSTLSIAWWPQQKRPHPAADPNSCKEQLLGEGEVSNTGILNIGSVQYSTTCRENNPRVIAGCQLFENCAWGHPPSKIYQMPLTVSFTILKFYLIFKI